MQRRFLVCTIASGQIVFNVDQIVYFCENKHDKSVTVTTINGREYKIKETLEQILTHLAN